MKLCAFCRQEKELVELEQRWINSKTKKLIKKRVLEVCGDCIVIHINRYSEGDK